ncbi:ABC transporter ATP-binding protein [uncultured Brevibacterium sp.]|uniref:ABC transporter ATP-binding protein n=1 Tax=uncultured Brevibacterium sp. TaxID=189678 RepID=UPI0025FC7B00|nr:ATP-binding cassette domain-containing protein [uncultured Brevibacterium sp.]
MSHLSATDFGWKHAGRKRAALTGISVEIEAGERVLIAGASGAGKSTFLHAVAGVLPSESGTQFGQLLIDGSAPDPTRGRTGLVLQDPDSQAVLSRIGPDIAFGAENLRVPVKEIADRVQWALDTVGLPFPQDWPTAKLSGGQKQRVALAGVLAMRPSTILLDEPTANIDPQSAPGLRDAVIRSADETGATLLVVEHRLDLWAQHVDRMVVLSPTGVIADGPPHQIMETHRQELEDAGLWLSHVRPKRRALREATGPQLLKVDATVGRHEDVNHVKFSLAQGQALAITGANGAGKSTAALTAAGLLRPRAGQVTASPELQAWAPEFPVRSPIPHKWKARALARRIGKVFQTPEHQFVTRTVRDELVLGGVDPDSVLERLRLGHVALAHPSTLSGGEKRRLSVACMLAAPVLIVDEPTFGQDAHSWRELASLLNEAVDGGAALLTVTHDPDFIHAVGADEYGI